MNQKIISYNTIFAQEFYKLNVEWLESFFYVEDFDREVKIMITNRIFVSYEQIVSCNWYHSNDEL